MKRKSSKAAATQSARMPVAAKANKAQSNGATERATKAADKVLSKAQRRVKAAAAKKALEQAVISAFMAAGYAAKSIKPRVNVLTPGKWAAAGFKPKAGAVPQWIRGEWMTPTQIGYPMYHRDQVEPLVPAKA